MKKIAAIFLLSIYLFSATDLKEIFKANVIVQHFLETKQLDSSVSLYQFLVMHYVTNDHNDNDNERDNQLPFKSPDSCIANSSLVSTHNNFNSLSFQSFAVNESDFSNANDAFVPINFYSLVWHPPQFS